MERSVNAAASYLCRPVCGRSRQQRPQPLSGSWWSYCPGERSLLRNWTAPRRRCCTQHTPWHTVEAHFQVCKSITTVLVRLKVGQFSLAPTWSRCHGVFRSPALRGRGRSSTPVLLHLHLLHTDKITTKLRVNQTFLDSLFCFNASGFFLFCCLVSFSQVLYEKQNTISNPSITGWFFFFENVSPSSPQDFITCI